jgi:hypothetical protein
MGYIMNPPFSIKDRTLKSDPRVTAWAAYSGEGKLITSDASRTGNFIFRAKRITFYILRCTEPASASSLIIIKKQSKLIARLKSTYQVGSREPPTLKDFSGL